MYTLNTEYNLSAEALNTQFTAYVDNLMTYCLTNGKVPMFSFGGKEDAILFADDSCAVDIGRYAGLVDKNKTLYDDIATERYKVHGGKEEEVPLTPKMKKVLFADYLLKSYICYVEILSGTTPQKFYATRNLELLEAMSQIDENDAVLASKRIPINKELKKAKVICAPLTLQNITEGMLRFLKIEHKKKTVSVVEPKLPTYIDNVGIRITPMYFNDVIAHYLWEWLKKEALEITYVKDNLVKRTVITTLNLQMLQKACDNNYDRACEMFNYANMKSINRGYMTLPELLLPLSDETGCRAVSFRICGLKPVDMNTFSNPFLYINLEGAPATFSYYLDMYSNNKPMLEQIKLAMEMEFGVLRDNKDDAAARAVVFEEIQNTSEACLMNDMRMWVDTGLLVDKTQVLRKLHLFMIHNPMLFARYTGRRVETSGGIDWTAGI